MGAQIAKLQEWHKDMIDYLILNPRATMRQMAEHFGVSKTWLSLVKNSDAFQSAYGARREDLSRAITANLAERVTTLSEIVTDELTRRVDENAEKYSVRELREILETTLRASGLSSGAPGGNSQLSLNLGNAPPSVLHEARALFIEVTQRRSGSGADSGGPVLEHEPGSPPSPVLQAGGSK